MKLKMGLIFLGFALSGCAHHAAEKDRPPMTATTQEARPDREADPTSSKGDSPDSRLLDHEHAAATPDDCENEAQSFKNEISLWTQAPQRVETSASATLQPMKMPVSAKALLKLAKESRMKFIVKPGKVLGDGSGAYGGLARIDFPREGIYRISMGSKVWIDLIDTKTGQPLRSGQFGMMASCTPIFKFVEFTIEKNKSYILQVSSSQQAEVGALISQTP